MNRRYCHSESSKAVRPSHPAAVKHMAAYCFGVALAMLASAGGSKADPQLHGDNEFDCHKHFPSGKRCLYSQSQCPGGQFFCPTEELERFIWDRAPCFELDAPLHCYDSEAPERRRSEEESERREAERWRLLGEIESEIVAPCLEHKIERIDLSEHDSLAEAIVDIRAALMERYVNQPDDIESALNEVLSDQRHLVFKIYLEDCKKTALDNR